MALAENGSRLAGEVRGLFEGTALELVGEGGPGFYRVFFLAPRAGAVEPTTSIRERVSKLAPTLSSMDYEGTRMTLVRDEQGPENQTLPATVIADFRPTRAQALEALGDFTIEGQLGGA